MTTRNVSILALALLACACCSKTPQADSSGVHVIRALKLNEGKTSYVGFESSYAQGMIEIGADVHIGYQSVTVSPDASGASRQVITLDGKMLDIWGPELKIGERGYGKLAGAVQIRIDASGVTVNGQKR